MAEYHIAIVEDVIGEAETLQAYLSKFFEKQTNYTYSQEVFNNGLDFLDSFSSRFDLVFLDIEMSGLSGMDTAKEIRRTDEDVCIVFVTHFAKYAVLSYEVRAFDYMVKPVSYADFEFKMKRILREIQQNIKRYIFLKFNREIYRVSYDEICYLEQRNHNLYWHLTGKRLYHIKSPLKKAEKELEDGLFLRCSSSYLVNLKHITAFRGNAFIVDGDEIPISRSQRKACESALINYIGGVLYK